jgi:PAS domain S-box-containing protein
MPLSVSLDEAQVLLGCVRDVVTRPTLWSDSVAEQSGAGAHGPLAGILDLEFASVTPRAGPTREITWLGEGRDSNRSAMIRLAIVKWLDAHPQSRDGEIADPRGSGTIHFASAPVGVGENSVLIAVSRGPGLRTPERPVAGSGAHQPAAQRRPDERPDDEGAALFGRFAENSRLVLWIVHIGNAEEPPWLEYLSPAFEQIWGEPREPMLGDRARIVSTIHRDDRARAAATMQRIIAGDVALMEYRIVRPDGSIRWINDIGFPICDEHGRLNRIGGIAKDVTKHDLSLVYLVDADDAVRQAVTRLLRDGGYEVKAFASPSAFLEVAAALRPGCVLLDSGSTWTDGMTALHELRADRIMLPVIVAGPAGGNVGLAVQAMKAGATDYLELPYDRPALLDAVAAALAEGRAAAEHDAAAGRARWQVARLSARERQVLDGLLAGGTNKTIARLLGISPRTVELHRARLMERLGASTLPEAVLIAAAAGVRPAGRGGGIDSVG